MENCSFALIFHKKEDLEAALEKLSCFKNSGNSVLPVCVKCGEQVDQKVVNFCKVRYKGKILCRDCQKEVTQ